MEISQSPSILEKKSFFESLSVILLDFVSDKIHLLYEKTRARMGRTKIEGRKADGIGKLNVKERHKKGRRRRPERRSWGWTRSHPSSPSPRRMILGPRRRMEVIHTSLNFSQSRANCNSQSRETPSLHCRPQGEKE